MKIVILVILGVLFLYHLLKAMVQAWPIGWPFQKTNLLNKQTTITNLELHSRFTKEAIKSLVICLIIVLVIVTAIQLNS